MRLDEIAMSSRAVAPDMPGAVLQEMFEADPHLLVVAVVDHHQEPMGMVNRSTLFQLMGGDFGRALYARRPVRTIMDDCPIILDIETKLTDIIASYVANMDCLH